ncbi:hypothetical protein [Thalassobacillus sp. C254]|uniref:hypothetical protein n=1 Tax=Thalassobacillus sp. C254 TaxID=1225341 RepID=UPI0006D1D92C|nr:hypothetical protein [Thalassobacillus sp. C254]
MGVPNGLCFVIITTTIGDTEVIVLEGTFPTTNGNLVVVEVLGTTLEIPCPSVDLEVGITVPVLGDITLVINAQPVAAQ